MEHELKKLLLASGRQSVFDHLLDHLGRLGDFSITRSTKLQRTLELLETFHIDAVLLDFDLDDFKSPEVCRIIRRQDAIVPIVVLADTHNEAEVILSLEAGANDYVLRTISVSELAARVRSQMRKNELMGFTELRIGPFMFKPRDKILRNRDNDTYVPLTDREASLLFFLAKHRDNIVQNEQIYRTVWGYGSILNTHTLQTHIYRLRRKIEENPARPRFLVSARSGYRLTSE